MARSNRETPSSLFADRAFWLGLGGIALGLVVFALLFNFAVMPIWTRHDAAVEVPDVREMTPDDAQSALLLAGLDWEEQPQPFNPNITPDVVVDQSPAAGTTVKPGRRVYYYVNASPKGLVVIPDVVGYAEGTARAAVEDKGLLVDQVLTDSQRTPESGTVTRQRPQGDSQVPAGTRVTLWISPGVDTSREVTVPDVVALPVEEAREAIREAELYVDPSQDLGGVVSRQEPAAGETLNPGEQVRLYVD